MNFFPINFGSISNSLSSLFSTIIQFGSWFGRMVSHITSLFGTTAKVDNLAKNNLGNKNEAIPANEPTLTPAPDSMTVELKLALVKQLVTDANQEEKVVHEMNRSDAEKIVNEDHSISVLRTSTQPGIAYTYYSEENKNAVNALFEFTGVRNANQLYQFSITHKDGVIGLIYGIEGIVEYTKKLPTTPNKGTTEVAVTLPPPEAPQAEDAHAHAEVPILQTPQAEAAHDEAPAVSTPEEAKKVVVQGLVAEANDKGTVVHLLERTQAEEIVKNDHKTAVLRTSTQPGIACTYYSEDKKIPVNALFAFTGEKNDEGLFEFSVSLPDKTVLVYGIQGIVDFTKVNYSFTLYEGTKSPTSQVQVPPVLGAYSPKYITDEAILQQIAQADPATLWYMITQDVRRPDSGALTPLFAVDSWYDTNVHMRFTNTPIPKETTVEFEGTKLNASRIRATESSKQLVAFHCPMAQDEHLFWQAFVVAQADVIDLTTDNCHNNTALSIHLRARAYYPMELDVEYNPPSSDLSIKLKSSQNLPSGSELLTYEVTQKDGASSTLRRMRFRNWDDNCHIEFAQLDQLVEEMRALNQNIWIHCRAGVGRTGSLIAADILKNRITEGLITKDSLRVSLLELIIDLRKDRGPITVQSFPQFEMLLNYGTFLLEQIEK